MSQYQYQLRNLLLNFTVNSHKDNLVALTTDAQRILDLYNVDKEVSYKGQASFYQGLHDPLKKYYEEEIYAPKKWYQKLAGFFGIRSQEEKNLIGLMKEAKSLGDKAARQSQSIWKEGFFAGMLRKLFAPHVTNPKMQLHSDNNDRNQGVRLRVISHRLMGKEEFKEEKYGHFHGLSPDLAAYKLKREIEKFYETYQEELTAEQKESLLDVIQQFEFCLAIDRQVNLSRFLEVWNNKFNDNEAEPSPEFMARYQDICFDLYEKLSHLPVGKKLVIRHGYTYGVAANKDEENQERTAGGHGALVEFFRQENTEFATSFFNTGSGITTQASGLMDFALLFFGKWRVSYAKDVSMDFIDQNQLVNQILKPWVFPAKDSNNALREFSKAAAVFKDGKGLKSKPEMKDLQVNGTCAYSCWLAWLKDRLDDGLFSSIELFINKKAYNKLGRFEENPEVNLVLKQGLTELREAGKKVVYSNADDIQAWIAKKGREKNNPVIVSELSAIKNIGRRMGVEVDQVQAKEGILGGIRNFFNL